MRRDPLGDGVHDDRRGVREAVPVREALAIVHDRDAEAEPRRKPAELQADVARAEDHELRRRLDRLDEDLHLPSANETRSPRRSRRSARTSRAAPCASAAPRAPCRTRRSRSSRRRSCRPSARRHGPASSRRPAAASIRASRQSSRAPPSRPSRAPRRARSAVPGTWLRLYGSPRLSGAHCRARSSQQAVAGLARTNGPKNIDARDVTGIPSVLAGCGFPRGAR